MSAEIAAQLLEFAEQTTDFVGVTDPWGRILYLNPAARKRLGLGDDAADLTTGDVFPPEAFALYYDVIRPELLRTGAWSGEIPVKVPGGAAVPMYVSTTARVGPAGEVNESVMIAREVSPVAPVAATGGAEVDETTGLLSRPAFEESARVVLVAASRDGESCALVLATVIHPRDTHQTFDALIRATVMRALAGRMKGLARTTDLVGRFGEDQLGLLLRGVRTRNEALRIARTVYESLVDAPITTAAEEIVPSVACGVGFADLGDDLADLIAEASAPLWNEAAAGRSVTDVPRARTGRSDALPTMDEFRIAMSHGDVRAYAQPVVHLGSGLITGYEGSARWHHRRLGTLDAEAFVDMISETPLASQVDLFVARETAAVLALTTRDRPLSLYAPASRRLIADVRTEQYLCEIVDAFSLSMNQMHLEVARALENNWTPALLDALQSLRDAGLTLVAADVEVASDAQRLVEVGFGELHLSPSLTNALATGAGARNVVSDIVQIAHGRGALVAGAGVSDPRHHHELVEAGCDLATGVLYGAAETANTID